MLTTVHIVPVRDEVDQVIEPAREHRVAKLYLIPDTDADETSEATIRDRLADSLIEVESHPCAHDDLIAVMGLVTTLAAKHDDEDTVLVNASTGGRTAAIGATIGCMDNETPARAFHVTQTADGRPVASSDPDDFLPDYHIESPTWAEVATLAIVYTEDIEYTQAKKRTVIDRMLKMTLDDQCPSRFELAMAVLDGGAGANHANDSSISRRPAAVTDGPREFDDLSGDDRKRAYGRLDSIVDPLEAQGHLEVTNQGRSKALAVTEDGENLLRAFRHKVQGVIEYQADNGRAEVPDWLKQGFTAADA